MDRNEFAISFATWLNFCRWQFSRDETKKRGTPLEIEGTLFRRPFWCNGICKNWSIKKQAEIYDSKFVLGTPLFKDLAKVVDLHTGSFMDDTGVEHPAHTPIMRTAYAGKDVILAGEINLEHVVLSRDILTALPTGNTSPFDRDNRLAYEIEVFVGYCENVTRPISAARAHPDVSSIETVQNKTKIIAYSKDAIETTIAALGAVRRRPIHSGTFNKDDSPHNWDITITKFNDSRGDLPLVLWDAVVDFKRDDIEQKHRKNLRVQGDDYICYVNSEGEVYNHPQKMMRVIKTNHLIAMQMPCVPRACFVPNCKKMSRIDISMFCETHTCSSESDCMQSKNRDDQMCSDCTNKNLVPNRDPSGRFIKRYRGTTPAGTIEYYSLGDLTEAPEAEQKHFRQVPFYWVPLDRRARIARKWLLTHLNLPVLKVNPLYVKLKENIFGLIDSTPVSNAEVLLDMYIRSVTRSSYGNPFISTVYPMHAAFSIEESLVNAESLYNGWLKDADFISMREQHNPWWEVVTACVVDGHTLKRGDIAMGVLQQHTLVVTIGGKRVAVQADCFKKIDIRAVSKPLKTNDLGCAVLVDYVFRADQHYNTTEENEFADFVKRLPLNGVYDLKR